MTGCQYLKRSKGILNVRSVVKNLKDISDQHTVVVCIDETWRSRVLIQLILFPQEYIPVEAALN